MSKRVEIDEALFRRLWAANVSHREMAAALGCAQSGIGQRAMDLELPDRAPAARTRGKNKPAQVTEHVAAVRMPSPEELDAVRPVVMAQLERMGATHIAIGQIAARNRLPRAIVAGMAGKVGME